MPGDHVRVRASAPAVVHATDGEAGFRFEDAELNVLDYTTDASDASSLLVLEIKNADAAVVNALRRIMLAEVETVAADVVGIKNNSSIVQDEVLAHRIGLVPFNIDPQQLNEDETLNFDVFKECLEGDSCTVTSGDLEWKPDNAEQEERFADKRPAPLHDDIPLAKLLPGQQVFMRALLRRGKGSTHAKFSPVATASYRLMPRITSTATGELAEEIKKACPKDVFDIEDTLVAKRPLQCTMCRECIRRDGWEDVVTLERDTSHFIMSIESVGSITAPEVFRRACTILHDKADLLLRELPEDE